MFEIQDKRRKRYAMPWDKPKRGERGSDMFDRGLFRESSRFHFPTTEEQEHSRFQNYFAFKTVRRIRRGLRSNAVLRNRILFVILCLSLFGFILFHLIRH